MNKKMLIALGALVVIIIVGVFIYLKMFSFGNSDYSNIQINKVTLSDDEVEIYGEYIDSKSAYKDYSYTLVGKELYLTVNHVTVSKKYTDSNFTIKIPVNGNEIDNIHLTDNKSTKVVFSK